MLWNELIGKKIVAFRGYKERNRKTAKLSFVLFNDKKTYLEFSEQSPYDYHDCDRDARVVDFQVDKTKWKRMFDKDGFEDIDPNNPF